ncbi:MAG: hypothetical protein ABSF32_06040 [Ignavibacteria bacterium]
MQSKFKNWFFIIIIIILAIIVFMSRIMRNTYIKTPKPRMVIPVMIVRSQT